MTAEERFWAKVDRGDGCWLWSASLNENGYGQFYLARRVLRAHRYSYELLRGPIPGDMEIDHLCKTRSCVNPDHMEIVTRAENVHRSTRTIDAETARRIRRARGSRAAICGRFGIGQTALAMIRNGTHWTLRESRS